MLEETKAVELVLAELDSACSKFPAFHSSHEGYAIIKKEVDTLWLGIKTNRPNRAKKGAVQVAAMALRYLIDLGEPYA